MKQKQLLSEIKQLLLQKYGLENENVINVAILGVTDKYDELIIHICCIFED